MTYLPEISLALALAGLAGTWRISHGSHTAWLYMAAFQIPASIYDIWTHQLGYLLTTLIGGYVYANGWRRRTAT